MAYSFSANVVSMSDVAVKKRWLFAKPYFLITSSVLSVEIIAYAMVAFFLLAITLLSGYGGY